MSFLSGFHFHFAIRELKTRCRFFLHVVHGFRPAIGNIHSRPRFSYTEGSKLRRVTGLANGSHEMNCDLCKRDKNTSNLLCACCADMIQRLITVDVRMRTREVCEAERLARSAHAGTAGVKAGASAKF